jgi:phage gp29-like protein
MKEVVLYGPDGQPVNTRSLQEELSGSLGAVRGTEFDSQADILTPSKLASIIKDMQEDPTAYLTLAIEMEEREPHYASVLQTRKLALSGIEPTVSAASDDKRDLEIAEAVRGLVSEPEFSDLVEDLLDALGKSFSVSEIIWRCTSERWSPIGYRWRDPRWFMFDYKNGEQIRLRTEGTQEGVPLIPYKYIVHYPRIRTGLKIRGGLARLAAAAYMCKNYAVKDWMRFIELFGIPMRVGRYDAGTASPTDKDVLKRAVFGLGTDAAAILPKGMDIEFEEIANTGAGATLFEKAADWFDKQVSKAVLGQTMTTDDGSSQSQANVHNEVRLDLRRADARRLAATINAKLIEPFVQLNFGQVERYPRIGWELNEPEDLTAMADSLQKLVPLGMKVEASVVRDRFGWPDPADGAELLMPPPSFAGNPALNAALQGASRRARTALNSQQAVDDELALIAAEMLDGWEEAADPLLIPIRNLIDDCETFEELQERLAEAAPAMNTVELTQRLALAMFKSRGAGDAAQN